ncbi:hypothetical protein GOBAR_DD07228 [Gossypium barbadense]|nr:hypothetical protein GOBAR_DD07228 [Gossypium barbadense]
MEARVEVDVMGWDLSLRAQSRRAQAMRSVLLREEGGSGGGMSGGNNERGNVGTFRGSVDPILGFNLKGNGFSSQIERVRPLNDYSQMAIEQELENEMIIGEEGKKRGRKDIENSGEMEGRDRKETLCRSWKI